MFRISDIRTDLASLIGWRQSETSDIQLSAGMLESDSGMYYQQGHALVTLQNLKAIAPQFDNTQKFEDWLKNKTGDSIIRAITRFFDEKVSQGSAKKVVENKVLFDGAGRISDVTNMTSGIVGFEIIPVRSKNITLKIEKIGLQFTGAGTINLFLMHSSNKQAVKHIPLAYSKTDGTFQWFRNQNIVLPYLGDNTDAGGSWYLCYSINNLPGDIKPIYKSRDWSKQPCTYCEDSSAGFQLLSKFAEFYPFRTEFTIETENSLEMFDLPTIFTPDSNYGINLEMSVVCDFTDFIMTNKRSFVNVILTQFAVDMLKEMCYNPNVRVNRNALLAQRSELLFALDGDTSSIKPSGLNYQLELAYKALDIDFKGVDRVCMLCKTGGIKYRTV